MLNDKFSPTNLEKEKPNKFLRVNNEKASACENSKTNSRKRKAPKAAFRFVGFRTEINSQ